jgi:hypothetical protein
MTSGKNNLEEISDLPQSSIGAPIPVVLSDEHGLFLCYYIENTAEDWDGSTTKVVSADTADETVAVIRFDRYAAYKSGPPNEETVAGHPLYKKGLRPHSIYRVNNSSWIEELEKMNSVHRHHDKKRFASLKHFIFVFHDSTFECVAEAVTFEIKTGSIRRITSELVDRL